MSSLELKLVLEQIPSFCKIKFMVAKKMDIFGRMGFAYNRF